MFIKRLYRKIRAKIQSGVKVEHNSISRSEHGLSRKAISDNALKVLYRLKKNGYAAYLVGGGVRDLLLNMPSKDFDIATDATPEDIRSLFKNSRIIGRRFRLVHILFKGEIIEVSTFRAEQQYAQGDDVASENIYGTLEEDAWRRDFTINSLYYNINDFSIVDYTNGWSDIQKRNLSFIGDAVERVHEDPIRLLRALRFMAKLNLNLDPDLEMVLRKHGELLCDVTQARILHEFEKIFCTGYALPTFNKLKEYGYLHHFFMSDCISMLMDDSSWGAGLAADVLFECDNRYACDKSLNLGFLLAVFLWPVLQDYMSQAKITKGLFHKVLHSSICRVLHEQQLTMSIPKRCTSMMKSVWLLQYNLERRRPRRILSLFRHRYYRAAYDLLVLRSQHDAKLQPLAKWWGEVYHAPLEQQEDMIAKLSKHKPRRN